MDDKSPSFHHALSALSSLKRLHSYTPTRAAFWGFPPDSRQSFDSFVFSLSFLEIGRDLGYREESHFQAIFLEVVILQKMRRKSTKPSKISWFLSISRQSKEAPWDLTVIKGFKYSTAKTLLFIVISLQSDTVWCCFHYDVISSQNMQCQSVFIAKGQLATCSSTIF